MIMNIVGKEQVSFIVRLSPFGLFALFWAGYGGQPKVCRVLLSKPGLPAEELVRKQYPGTELSGCDEIGKVADEIEAFLSGENISFSLDETRIDTCTIFQQDVLRTEHGIPRGYVSTYKRIAEHLGKREGARAVGTALATNPFPIIIPCHRAIRSDGSLGGYQGGLEMKRKLLEMEGITVGDKGCVSALKYFY
ncbi:MAG: methylated-DNA--[protein]-cysteine S-methyltransferase [Desulfobacteraceae bacterium]|nr:MAG: methylated-DNA--[protein]-cysteine S-methyltransferase [Desulfobacteraceae bacterium]